MTGQASHDKMLAGLGFKVCAPTATRTRDLLLRRTWAVILGLADAQVSGQIRVSGK